jgi:hypothetical protein
MAREVDLEPIDNYSVHVDLYELTGEISGYDYGASGRVESVEDISSLARLSNVHLEQEDETYKGIEVQVLFEEKYFEKIGRELF